MFVFSFVWFRMVLCMLFVFFCVVLQGNLQKTDETHTKNKQEQPTTYEKQQQHTETIRSHAKINTNMYFPGLLV